MTTLALPDTAPEAGGASARADAVRDLLVMAPGVVPFGLFLGITVATTGTGAIAGILGAGLVYGGSAQLATIALLHLGAGVIAAVLAGLIINARILLYGAALEPWFRGQPRWFRVLGPQFILDQTYLAAAQRPGLRDRAFRRYWGWLGFSLLAVWVAAVTTGVLAAPLLPDLPHLVLVGAGLFLGMLVPRLVDPASWAACLAGGGATWTATLFAPEVAVLVGSLAGVAAAVTVSGRTRRTP